jgi:hypothetical protein
MVGEVSPFATQILQEEPEADLRQSRQSALQAVVLVIRETSNGLSGGRNLGFHPQKHDAMNAFFLGLYGF